MGKYLKCVIITCKAKTMQKQLKNITIWLVIFSVWTNKYYNLNPFLGFPKINNFLDLLISSTDIVVVVLSFWFFILTFFYSYFQPHTKYFVQPTVSHLFALVTLLVSFLVNPSYGLLMIIARIFLLINIVPKLLHESNKKFRVTLMIALLFAMFFDHFLISSSLPVILLLILSMKLGFWQKNLVYTYLLVNFVVAVFQIIKGQSLGLIYLGEPVINADTLNIARETIFGTNILRGYGLTQHPALLGFVAVFGLLFNLKNTTKYQYNTTTIDEVENYTTDSPLPHERETAPADGVVFRDLEPVQDSQPKKYLSLNFLHKQFPLFTSVLSLSRISLLTFLFGWMVNTKTRLHVYQKIVCIGAILGLFFYRFVTSDKYRILDYQTWTGVTLSMTFRDMFFGIGYYPEFLHNFYQGIEVWQMQPNHNTVFGVFTQFGVWGFLGLIGWLYFDLMKPYFDNKKKKEQEL
jgi:hypothetical protein